LGAPARYHYHDVRPAHTPFLVSGCLPGRMHVGLRGIARARAL